MDQYLTITALNDFVFCPLSLYYHNLYGAMNSEVYYSDKQYKGKNAHKTIDTKTYSSKKNILQGTSVYSESYKLCGKIDLFDMSTGILTERKKKIIHIYDGYVYQLYGQYFGLQDMGYEVKKLQLHSLDDNKTYPVKMPEEDDKFLRKFEDTIYQMNHFNPNDYHPVDERKCRNCIYTEICAESLYDE